MELDQVLLQLFSNFSFLFEQVDPSRVDVSSPLHQENVALLNFICEDDFVFEEVVVVSEFFVEFHVLGVGRRKILFVVLHFLSSVFGPVAVEVEHCLQGRNQDLFDPGGEDFQVFHFGFVEFSQFEGCPMEGLINEVLFVFFAEVEFPHAFVEGRVEAEGVFEVFDEVFDKLFGVLDFIFEEGLQG